MLQTIKEEISEPFSCFECVFVDYLMMQKDLDIKHELEFVKKHNDLDVFDLDGLINSYFMRSY